MNYQFIQIRTSTFYFFHDKAALRFQATSYACPDSSEERRSVLEILSVRIEDMKAVNIGQNSPVSAGSSYTCKILIACGVSWTIACYVKYLQNAANGKKSVVMNN